MLEVKDLLNLPWATLLTLACGYAAYFIANRGNREHHKTIDVVFSVLVFGFPCTAVYRWTVTDLNIEEPYASLVAVLLALSLGAAWSLFGRSLFDLAMKNGNISHTDDLRSAWSALGVMKGSVNCTQLTVCLKDGTTLHCEDLSRFTRAPNGPFIFGATGDVLMYVTHSTSAPTLELTTAASVEHSWGWEITYIPAADIGQIKLRRQWRKKVTSSAAA